MIAEPNIYVLNNTVIVLHDINSNIIKPPDTGTIIFYMSKLRTIKMLNTFNILLYLF